MFNIRYAMETDKTFWFTLDEELRESEFDVKIRDKRAYIIFDDDKPVGIMRYNLCWDCYPFLTLIYLDEAYRKNGFGRQAMLHWENEMRKLDHKMIMTSTQVSEESQHFYRKLGYKEKGSIVFEGTPYPFAMEMFLVKVL